MDPNAALEQIRNLIARHLAGDIMDTDDLVHAVDDLDAWITRHGFLPKDWEPAKPKVEIDHNRDYDGYCEIALWVNGKRTGFTEYSIDPGAGHEFLDYADTLSDMIVSASPALKDRLTEGAYYALTDRYTEGGPDDDRVAYRYLDWLVFCKEREVAATNPHPTAAQEDN